MARQSTRCVFIRPLANEANLHIHTSPDAMAWIASPPRHHGLTGHSVCAHSCLTQRTEVLPTRLRHNARFPIPKTARKASHPRDAPAAPSASPRPPALLLQPVKVISASVNPLEDTTERRRQESTLPGAEKGKWPPRRLAGSYQGSGYLSVAVSSPVPLSEQKNWLCRPSRAAHDTGNMTSPICICKSLTDIASSVGRSRKTS